MPTRNGSIHLFKLAGVDVWLHWSWFVVAMIEIANRRGVYASQLFNLLECLTLFVIVLMHEYGHALACRSVGGKADEIVLWPLGGVAYVAPPMRPGATLWSIAAGPLVNVALLVVFGGAWVAMGVSGWTGNKDIARYVTLVTVLNSGLLVFNLLPVYPLDGGQILRSLLWFAFGKARSLMIASVIGFVGIAAALVWVGVLAVSGATGAAVWNGIMAVFLLSNCWRGLVHARQLAQAEKLPRRDGFACPSCRQPPPVGAWWTCGHCRTRFDAFATQGVCPNCGAHFSEVRCLDCGESGQFSAWVAEPRLRG